MQKYVSLFITYTYYPAVHCLMASLSSSDLYFIFSVIYAVLVFLFSKCLLSVLNGKLDANVTNFPF